MCNAPPPSPVGSDTTEQKVLLISTMDKIHKQVTAAHSAQSNDAVITHSKGKYSEIHLTFPIKIEETNQHGLIQYPTDSLLLDHEINPPIDMFEINEQNKLIQETIESIKHPD